MKRILNTWLGNSAALIAATLLASAAAPAQWLNYPAAGIPRTRDHKPDMAAAAPKTSNGKPDFSGIWEAEDQTYFFDLAAGLKPEDVVPTPCGQRAILKQRQENDHADDPLA